MPAVGDRASLTAEEQAHLLQGAAALAREAGGRLGIHRRDHRGDPRSAALRALRRVHCGIRRRVFATPPARAPIITRAAVDCVEHTAQMMRVAAQIAPLYPDLNLDLLVAGILFHDSGKLWENYLPETGFSMPFDERGEMIGHIAHRDGFGQFALAQNPDRRARRPNGKSSLRRWKIAVCICFI